MPANASAARLMAHYHAACAEPMTASAGYLTTTDASEPDLHNTPAALGRPNHPRAVSAAEQTGNCKVRLDR
jgi:hypothetical protein